MIKKLVSIILGIMLILPHLSGTIVSADTKYKFDINETLKTTRTEAEYNSSFLSVTGYAKGVVNDRTEYIGTDYYRLVSNGDEFVQAIEDARDGKVKVIEVNNDINLGYYELSKEAQNARCIELYDDPYNTNNKSGTYTNPTIKQSGVSKLSINSTKGLTIFSRTGNCIRHVEFKIQYGSSDIIFRNLEFDDMWQWDESGNHKEVGWAFFKINGAKNVWIDHCTFSIAADALIDLENASSGVTYQWCRFSKDAEMPEKYDPVYKTITYMEYKFQNGMVDVNGRYSKMRSSKISTETLMKYESFHSKCFGVGNEKQFKDLGSGSMPEDSAQRVRLTFAYNYLTNVGQRIPRLSVGRTHIINMYVDNEGHEKLQKSNNTLSNLGGNSLRANLCINVHTGGSCAADTCVYNYVEKPIAGNEYQGEYGGTGLSSDPVLSHCWRDAKNRALILNSKVVTTSGKEYTGSSWDNNGENPFLEEDFWEIGAGQTVIGTPKTTIGDWAWATNIVGVEDMTREDPPKTAFVFEDDYEAELGYDYQVLPLESVEETVMKYSGAYKMDMTEEQWLQVSYDADEKIELVDSDKEIKAERVTIRQKDQIVGTGDLFQLDADVAPGNVSDRNVIWESSNSDIMEVLDSGLVIVKESGVATITATAADGSGVKDTVDLVSQVPVSKVELNYKTKTVTVGDTLQLVASVLPENAANKHIVFSVLNEEVASVDQNGFVISLKEGRTMIYATSVEDSTIRAALTLNVKAGGTAATTTPEVTVTPEVSNRPGELGDVNGDSKVDASDALLVLKHAAKIQELSELTTADVDKNEKVDAADALLILKLAAKIIDSF